MTSFVQFNSTLTLTWHAWDSINSAIDTLPFIKQELSEIVGYTIIYFSLEHTHTHTHTHI